MKATELMIGDWVLTLDSTHKEKVFAQVDAIEEGKHSILVTRECSNWFVDIDWIESIPLTPEILEKNGFKPYIPKGHLETVYACQDVSNAVADELYALWPYQEGSFYLLLRVDGKDMVRVDVHYVHQLKHALRLCGIEKEIVL